MEISNFNKTKSKSPLIYLTSSSSSSSSSECSAQGQILHCKRRNQFYQGLNKCSSFSLLSAHHSLFRIWTDLKRSEKIPGEPTWRRGERIWLTGPSGFHRNSPPGLNIISIRVFDQIRDPEILITLRPIAISKINKWKIMTTFGWFLDRLPKRVYLICF